MLDRCVLVEMNAGSIEQLLPFARTLARDLGADISDEDLIPTIKGANGSFRNLKHNVERHIRRKNIPPNIIF